MVLVAELHCKQSIWRFILLVLLEFLLRLALDIGDDVEIALTLSSFLSHNANNIQILQKQSCLNRCVLTWPGVVGPITKTTKPNLQSVWWINRSLISTQNSNHLQFLVQNFANFAPRPHLLKCDVCKMNCVCVCMPGAPRKQTQTHTHSEIYIIKKTNELIPFWTSWLVPFTLQALTVFCAVYLYVNE